MCLVVRTTDALLHLGNHCGRMGSAIKKLYGDDSYPGQLQHHPSAGDRRRVAGIGGRVGKLGKSGISHRPCCSCCREMCVACPFK